MGGRWQVGMAVLAVAACGSGSGANERPDSADAAFAAVQARGESVMGVNQYTSQHVFEGLPDGGWIILERSDTTDSAGIATIRAHIDTIVSDFRTGNFNKPFQVHAQVVPGTAVMAARASEIEYQAVTRPGGAAVRITTTDPTALAAVHEFLAFQRSDHRAAGHSHE